MRLYERVQFRRHEDILYDQVKLRQVISVNGYVCSPSLGLQSLSGQARLSKSLELWPYYVGLE